MQTLRNEIRFLLNDREVHVSDVGASDTLLDHLRLNQNLRGTKEGCAEGDCGACTVLVGRLHQGQLKYETVNACIRLLPSVDGCHVVTVENLRGVSGDLHPVQQALIDLHGSQCGFCTPGIVMSLYALWIENSNPSVADVEAALQGNLCRCTGYEPIIRAATSASDYDGSETDVLATERNSVTAKLQGWRDGSRVQVARNSDVAVLPADLDDLAEVLIKIPKATIVAGSTDVGLWITKFMRDISPAILTGHLDELKDIIADDAGMTLGAGVTYSECETALIEHFPHLGEFWRRIGGWQVRNMGTVGGNIANGSPIGDTPPVLIALGAVVTLRRGSERRTLPLEAFFTDYGKQDRKPGEFVESIHIPHVTANTLHAAYKISKRRDEDISSVAGGFAITLDGETVTGARLAFGGMAATALVGQPWSEATVRKAMAALREDFMPITDWRASAEYRAKIAENLLLRFYRESTATDAPVRLSA